MKINPLGDTVWTKKISFAGKYTFGYSLKQTTDGGYIICGMKDIIFSDSSQVLLVKTDLNGNVEWQKTYGGTHKEIGYDVYQTNDNGFIVTGASQSFGTGDWDFYLIKTDDSGNSIWQKSYGNSNSDIAHTVKQTSDGGYIVFGESTNIAQGNLVDLYLIRTNSLGDTLWTKKYNGNTY